MTLFFLILLVVSLTIFVFQKLGKKPALTIKPSLPKAIEPVEKPIEPRGPVLEIKPEPALLETKPEPELMPIVTELPKPQLPVEEEPILLSPKDSEPPGNLPVG